MKNEKKSKPKTVVLLPNRDFLYNSYFHYFILFAGTFLLYGKTYTYNFGLDDGIIINNLILIENDLNGIIEIFKTPFAELDYRPMLILSFWVQRFIFGSIEPSTSHLINILLYFLIIIFIYRFIISTNVYRDKNHLYVFALLCCIFFLVHPNHANVVSNIKSRDNLLSMLFGLIASIELIKVYDNKQYWRTILFIFFMTIAFLSKLDAYVFMFLPLLVLLFFRHLSFSLITTRFITTIVLSFIVITLFGYIKNNATFNLATQSTDSNPLFENNPSFADTISLAMTSLLYYLKFLFIPSGYYFYFGSKEILLQPLFSIINIASIIIYTTLLLLSLHVYRINRIYIFCLIFFTVSIAYALNLYTPVAGIVADRYNFIASLGFCIAVSAIFIDLAKAKNFSVFKNPLIYLLIIIWSGFAYYRSTAWKDHFTLLDRDLIHLSKSIHANRLAAGIYINEVLMDQQSNGSSNKKYTDSLINLAEKLLERSLSLSDNSAKTWEYMGVCALYRNNDSSGLNMFKKSYSLNPTNMNVANCMGLSYWRMSKIDSAEKYFKVVINNEPYFGIAANNLITIYIQNNQNQKKDSLIKALLLKYPSDNNLLNKISTLK